MVHPTKNPFLPLSEIFDCCGRNQWCDLCCWRIWWKGLLEV